MSLRGGLRSRRREGLSGGLGDGELVAEADEVHVPIHVEDVAAPRNVGRGIEVLEEDRDLGLGVSGSGGSVSATV